jgi:hypothetical protein
MNHRGSGPPSPSLRSRRRSQDEQRATGNHRGLVAPLGRVELRQDADEHHPPPTAIRARGLKGRPFPGVAGRGCASGTTVARGRHAQRSAGKAFYEGVSGGANATIAPSVHPLRERPRPGPLEPGRDAPGPDEQRQHGDLHEDENGRGANQHRQSVRARRAVAVGDRLDRRRYNGEGRNIATPSTKDHFWLVVARCDPWAIRPSSWVSSLAGLSGSRVRRRHNHAPRMSSATPMAIWAPPLADWLFWLVAPDPLSTARPIRPALTIMSAAPAKMRAQADAGVRRSATASAPAAPADRLRRSARAAGPLGASSFARTCTGSRFGTPVGSPVESRRA